MSTAMTVFGKSDIIAAGSPIDKREVAKNWVTWIILGCVGLLIGVFVLPIILQIVNTMVMIGVGLGFIAIMWLIYSIIKPNWPILVEKLTKIVTLGIIQWDDFIIQETSIKAAKRDVEEMVTAKEGLEGHYIGILKEVKEQQDEKIISLKEAEIARRDQDHEQENNFIRDAERAQMYVDQVAPLGQDMKSIIDFTTEMYKVIKNKILNAEKDLQISKKIFYTVTTGSLALDRAKRAAIGDPEMNARNEMAKQVLKDKIAMSIGQMRTSMNILNDVAKQENYRDKAKLELAKEQLYQINNLDNNGAVPIPQQSITFKGIEKASRYTDLL